MVHNPSFPAPPPPNADRRKQTSCHSSTADARCSLASARLANMTRNADDFSPEAWKLLPVASSLAATTATVCAANASTPTTAPPRLPPTALGGPHSQQPPNPLTNASTRLHGPSHNRPGDHRERPSSAQSMMLNSQQLAHGWTMNVSCDGRVQILCPESLKPYAQSIFDSRLLSRIRHQVTAAAAAAAASAAVSGLGSHERFQDPVCVIDVPDHLDGTSSPDDSRDSSVSPPSAQWPHARPGHSNRPANILKRRRSGVSPQSQHGDPRDLNYLNMDLDDDQLGSDITPGNDTCEAPPPPSRTSFRLDEEDKAIKFLGARFGDLQQATCKVILKDWIKRVEPKKQSKYPYSASNRDRQVPRNQKTSPTGAPPWWPPALRHKEPDHIDKEERRSLFLHLLLLCKDPNYKGLLDQSVQEEVRYGWVNMLEDSTKDKTLRIDREKDGMRFERRKKILHDIYHCARSLEEAWAGEIDMETRVTYQDPPPLSRGRYPKKDPNPRPVPSKTAENASESKSKFVAEVSEDTSDEKDDESEWDLLPPEIHSSAAPTKPFAGPTDFTHSQQIRISTSAVPSSLSESSLPYTTSDHTSSATTSISSTSNQPRRDIPRPHRRRYQNPTAATNHPQSVINGSMPFQSSNLASPSSADNQSGTAQGADSAVSSDSDNFTMHSARARQHMRQFSSSNASRGQNQPYPQSGHPNSDTTPLTIYSPALPDPPDVKPQPIDIPATEPSYDLKPVNLDVETEEPDDTVRYGMFTSDPHGVFGFTSGPDQFHGEGATLTEDSLMTRELSGNQPIHSGQQFESAADYNNPSIYDNHRGMNCAPANANFSQQISTTDYASYNSHFAQPLPMPYSTTASSNTFQAPPTTTFPSRTDYSFQSPPDVASPNSLYAVTPTSSTMGLSPSSATSNYSHTISIDRQLATLSPYQETPGGSAFAMPNQTPMRKTMRTMSLSSAAASQGYTSSVQGLSMEKATLAQNTSDSSFRPPYLYLDDTYDTSRQYNMQS